MATSIFDRLRALLSDTAVSHGDATAVDLVLRLQRMAEADRMDRALAEEALGLLHRMERMVRQYTRYPLPLAGLPAEAWLHNSKARYLATRALYELTIGELSERRFRALEAKSREHWDQYRAAVYADPDTARQAVTIGAL
jgi:hypothetical protein